MRWLRICIYVGATLFTIFYWSFALAAFIVSSPRSGETWGEAGISPRTNNLIKTTVVPAVGGMIVDIWLFVLPLVAIYKLQLHSTRRIGLTIMFGTGLLLVFHSLQINSSFTNVSVQSRRSFCSQCLLSFQNRDHPG